MIELLLPARLGRNFRWLFASSSVSNVADGIMLAACGPDHVFADLGDVERVWRAIFD